MNTNRNEETPKTPWDCYSINSPTPRKIRRMRRIEQKRERKQADREREILRQATPVVLPDVFVWPEG